MVLVAMSLLSFLILVIWSFSFYWVSLVKALSILLISSMSGILTSLSFLYFISITFNPIFIILSSSFKFSFFLFFYSFWKWEARLFILFFIFLNYKHLLVYISLWALFELHLISFSSVFSSQIILKIFVISSLN